jgi:hypothetical protein
MQESGAELPASPGGSQFVSGVQKRRAMGTYVTVEILRVEKNRPPRVLKRLRHSAHSLEAVFAATENVIRSPRSATGANAFHIVSDSGMEIYRWPDD